jgi:hypothetical protein
MSQGRNIQHQNPIEMTKRSPPLALPAQADRPHKQKKITHNGISTTPQDVASDPFHLATAKPNAITPSIMVETTEQCTRRLESNKPLKSHGNTPNRRSWSVCSTAGAVASTTATGAMCNKETGPVKQLNRQSTSASSERPALLLSDGRMAQHDEHHEDKHLACARRQVKRCIIKHRSMHEHLIKYCRKILTKAIPTARKTGIITVRKVQPGKRPSNQNARKNRESRINVTGAYDTTE